MLTPPPIFCKSEGRVYTCRLGLARKIYCLSQHWRDPCNPYIASISPFGAYKQSYGILALMLDIYIASSSHVPGTIGGESALIELSNLPKVTM